MYYKGKPVSDRRIERVVTSWERRREDKGGSGTILFLRLVDCYTSFCLLLFVPYACVINIFSMCSMIKIIWQNKKAITCMSILAKSIVILPLHARNMPSKKELVTFRMIIAKHPCAPRIYRILWKVNDQSSQADLHPMSANCPLWMLSIAKPIWNLGWA